MKRLMPVTVLCVGLYGLAAGAAERLQLDQTTILGNRELPKVTFVVPWADAAAPVPAWAPEPTMRPAAVPLDAELYRRELEYLKQQESDGHDGKP